VKNGYEAIKPILNLRDNMRKRLTCAMTADVANNTIEKRKLHERMAD